MDACSFGGSASGAFRAGWLLEPSGFEFVGIVHKQCKLCFECIGKRLVGFSGSHALVYRFAWSHG